MRARVIIGLDFNGFLFKGFGFVYKYKHPRGKMQARRPFVVIFAPVYHLNYLKIRFNAQAISLIFKRLVHLCTELTLAANSGWIIKPAP